MKIYILEEWYKKFNKFADIYRSVLILPAVLRDWHERAAPAPVRSRPEAELLEAPDTFRFRLC